MLDVVTITAPAKLNLALAVGSRDDGGYHPICSWIVSIDLRDELEVTRLLPDRFSRYAILWHAEATRRTEIDWPITDDLAVRAHLALERHVERHLPVQLKLEKRIPVGGGLGGGSSNAAAMLHALNEMFELGLALDELASIGATLGADVPFLVYGGSAIVEGLGERVAPHEEVPQLDAVVAFPDVQCPTGPVYGRFDELSMGPMRPEAVRALASAVPHAPRPDGLFNDLTRAAIRVAPELEDHLAALSAVAERPAHLTGSGSSIFVVCDDPVHAEYLVRAFGERSGLPAVAVRAIAGRRSTARGNADAQAVKRPGRGNGLISTPPRE